MSGETVNPHSESDLLRDQVVAYLDGELEPEASQAFEQRLSEDPELRRQVQMHQETWDLLDGIPRTEVSETFTQTTVEMIAVSTEEDIHDIRRQQTVKHRYYWLATVAAALFACVLGFSLMWYYVTAPNRQLVDDLPIIENLDAYRNSESVDFLRALEQEGLFVAEARSD
jgi:anti-sigma-K factor RskA